jgi:hypothetical protein
MRTTDDYKCVCHGSTGLHGINFFPNLSVFAATSFFFLPQMKWMSTDKEDIVSVLICENLWLKPAIN